MATVMNKPILRSGRDEVYVATVPLRASKGPAQLLMSAAYSVNLWDLQHFMVMVKTTTAATSSSSSSSCSLSSPPPSSLVFVFDFQPQDPEDVSVAIAVLSGKAVPGIVGRRKMRKIPRSRCWFIGFSEFDTLKRASEFNESWDTNLRVGHHDCRDYTDELVKKLTGEENVLERLRLKQ